MPSTSPTSGRTIMVAILATVGLATIWLLGCKPPLVPRHVYLEFWEGDNLVSNMYLRDADASLADVSFTGEKPQVQLLFTRGNRAAGYAVRGASGVRFGSVTIAVGEGGVTVAGRRYPLGTMVITKDGEVMLNAAIPEAL